MFKKKKKAVKFINNDYILISQNNMIDICTDACSVCWDKAVPEDFEKREKYISARTRIGHESVIEHSNVVLLLQIKPNQVNDLIEVLSNCRYLNTDTKYYDNKYMIERVVKSDGVVVWFGLDTNWKRESDGIWRVLTTNENAMPLDKYLPEIVYGEDRMYFKECDMPIYEKLYIENKF